MYFRILDSEIQYCFHTFTPIKLPLDTEKRLQGCLSRVFQVALEVKNPPAKQEMLVQYLGREDPLKEGMAVHSSILAWGIPWTEKPGGLQSVGLQKVGCELAPKPCLDIFQLLWILKKGGGEDLKKLFIKRISLVLFSCLLSVSEGDHTNLSSTAPNNQMMHRMSSKGRRGQTPVRNQDFLFPCSPIFQVPVSVTVSNCLS